MKKGFVHIFSLVLIAVLALGGLSLLSHVADNQAKKDVGKVLSDRDSGGESHDSGGSSGGSLGGDSRSGGSNSGGTTTSPRPSSSNSSNSGSATNVRIEQKKTSEQKVEVRSPQGEFKSKVENGKQEIKIRDGNFRLEIKVEDGKVVTKVKNEKDEEVEVEDEVEDELVKEASEKLEDRGIKVASNSAELGFVEKGHRVRTNFPLTVNPVTGELIVTTPAGAKVVTVLPNVAIENLIKAGVLTSVVENTPTGTNQASGGASVAGASIQLLEFANKPAFLIPGVKREKFLGLVPVGLKKETVVSAENGELLDIRENLATRILDTFSF